MQKITQQHGVMNEEKPNKLDKEHDYFADVE